jgi:thymidylate synthase ThyX
MEASAQMEQELCAAGLEDVAQYAVSMAYRIRFVMQMSAREALHLTELRSQPQGHPTYRRVAQTMHRLIADVAGHHAIAEAFTYLDSGSVDLERLEAERRLEARRTSTGQSGA